MAGTITASGNEITDAVRQAKTQGDGRDPESSYGIWGATTNLITNGGAETNITGWAEEDAPGIIARSTAAHKFGIASGKFTTSTSGMSGVSSPGVALTSGVTYTWSIWVTSDTGRTLRMHVLNAAKSLALPTAEVITNDTWQKLTATYTAAATETHYLGLYRVEAGDTDIFFFDGAQIEAQTVDTPYVETDGGTATRSAARVRIPSSVLDETQGWVAFRIRTGFAAIDDPHAGSGMALCDWRDDVNNRLTLNYRPDIDQFTLSRVATVGGTTQAMSAVQTFAADTTHTVVAAWTATSLKISVDAAGFVTQASTAIPALAQSLLEIGTLEGGILPLEGDIFWFACGKGTVDSELSQRLAGLTRDPSFDAGDFSTQNDPTVIWSASNSTYAESSDWANAAETTVTWGNLLREAKAPGADDVSLASSRWLERRG